MGKVLKQLAQDMADAESLRAERSREREVAKLKSQLAVANQKLKQAEADLEHAEQRVDFIRALDNPTPARFEFKPAKPAGNATAILVLSDWHVEETVEADTINEQNEFNLEIAAKRIQAVFENAVKLIDSARHLSNIKDLVVAILGDVITGYIHDELVESNSLSPTEASLFAQDQICGGLDFLLKHAGMQSITVPTCYGNHGRCHDVDTELLTAAGWKRHDEIIIGESVATYRMDTGQCEWQPLRDLYVDHYSGDMIKVKHASADWMVTPRHRMVVADYHTDRREFREMGGLSQQTIGAGYFPKCAEGLAVDMPDVTDDELRLIGWVMTDGSYPRYREGYTGINLHQSKPRTIEVIRGLLVRMGYEYTEYKRHRKPPVIQGRQVLKTKPEVTFHIKMTHVARVLELLPDKHAIPSWFYKLSERQVRVWLDAILDGDGARSRNRRSDSAKHGKHSELHGRRSFLDQVQSLLIVNGVSSRVRTNCRGDAVLSIRGTTRGYINNWDKSVSVVKYSGTIWCGTVDNGTLVTRRNGIPLISGNTTQKMRASTAAQNSYEWLLYKQLERYYRGNAKIKWKVERGHKNYLDVQGHVVRFTHGDAFKYGGGVGGAFVPIRRKIAKWDKGRPSDYDIFGHLHTHLKDTKWCMNNSLIGLSPYGDLVDGEWMPPSQTLVVFDKGIKPPVLVQEVFCD